MRAGDLLEHCVSNDAVSRQICEHYIGGIVDYHRLILTIEASPTVDLCIPQNVTRADMADRVAEYLSINQQHNDFLAPPAVVMALFEHYPCKQRR